MTGLIILLILIPIAFFILLITLLNRSSEQQKLTESLYDRIKHLSEEIAGLSKEIKNLKQPAEPKPATVEEKPVHRTVTPPVKVTSQIDEQKEEIKPIITPGIEKREPIKPVLEDKSTGVKIEAGKTPGSPAPILKKETDLEKFIGENLANKIGIAVLVLGISFFVKYAIDKDWIKESGRIIIGLIAGGILIGIAHRIRNTYRSFSSVLVGGGLTVFYFTIAFAFHQYHLISQQAGFILMVIITGFAVLLSLYYDRLELAILATIGGFITPFLVSTGQENYIALFTYLCILNSGLMVLAWFKRWPSINVIALFFTIIIYGSWLVRALWYDPSPPFPYKDAMLFGVLFYVQFVAMNIINNIRQKKAFNAYDFLIVLSINFLFYLAGMFILSYWNDGKYQGLFTAMLGLFNLSLAIGFRQKKTIDPNFLSLLTGLAISYISLIAPVELRGNHVTLFWSAEMLVLFWLFQRTRIVQLKIASLIVAVAMIISLVLIWGEVYIGQPAVPILFNKVFITTIAVAAAIFIYYKLMYKESDSYYLTNITNQAFRNILLSAFIIILYVSGAIEIFHQFSTRNEVQSIFSIYLQLYTFIFTIVILFSFRRSSIFAVFKLLFTLLCFGLYLINITTNHEISLALLLENKGGLFVAHWLGVLLMIWLLLDLVIYFKNIHDKNWASYLSSFTWISAIGIVLILSVELYQVNLWFNYRKGEDWTWWENLYYKAGLSILWSICSFIMMWLGMHFKFRPLRIISLTLFTITLIKLFIYDIRNIPPGGKIAAFILLGILLLTVSFMYQRLKKIIIDDTQGKDLSV